MSKEDRYLKAYQVAINTIDDYFEYSNESKADRIIIHNILGKLNKSLAEIHNEEINGVEVTL